jgi:hypothetical protein
MLYDDPVCTLRVNNPAVGLSALIELVRYGILLLLVLLFPRVNEPSACLERSLEVLARLSNDLR